LVESQFKDHIGYVVREFAKIRHLYITIKPVNLFQTDYSTSQLPLSDNYLYVDLQYPKVYTG